MGHGEMTKVIARVCWHVVVGGKFFGALRIIRGCGFFGFGRNRCRLNNDAVMLAGIDIPS
jgi:hypothetical protein